jgi:hypothetical protein
MLKRLVCGAASLMLMAGVASVQTYPPSTTPPEMPAPEMGVPAPGRSTTTIRPSSLAGWQATTTRHGLDKYGNPVTERDIYREGIAGSSESHMTTIDPAAGGTTTSKPTTANLR